LAKRPHLCILAEGEAVGEGESSLPIETWARSIQARGLAPLAVPVLELARAFGFLVNQTLLMAAPLLAGTADSDVVRQAADLLGDPEHIDRLLARIEEEGHTDPGGQDR
jgi:hypothetical protein